MTDTADTRERIIDRAMDLFVYQGYAATGLAQIAKESGAHGGSVYHFFPTKEDLLRAVLERRKELLFPEVLAPIWKKIDDPVERIFALMDGYRRMLRMSEFSHGCPIGNLALEISESHPAARRLLAENFDNWLHFVEQCISDARDRLPPDVEPRTLAIFVLTTMEGAVMLARTYRSFQAYDAAIATLRDHFDRLLAMGATWAPPREGGRPRGNRAAPGSKKGPPPRPRRRGPRS